MKITQTLNHSVQRLEERLGVRLLERTSKTIRLTEDGERFCAEALPLFSQLGEVAEGMVKVVGKGRGRLGINVERWFVGLFVARGLEVLFKEIRGVRLELWVW